MIWPFNTKDKDKEENDNRPTGSSILGRDRYSKEDEEWFEQAKARNIQKNEMDKKRNKLNEIIGELKSGNSTLTH